MAVYSHVASKFMRIQEGRAIFHRLPIRIDDILFTGAWINMYICNRFPRSRNLLHGISCRQSTKTISQSNRGKQFKLPVQT